jgi:hypothetical protein
VSDEATSSSIGSSADEQEQDPDGDHENAKGGTADRRRQRIRHFRECAGPCAPVAEFGPRHAGAAAGRRAGISRRQALDDTNQAIAVAVRQRPQQHGIDDAEDRAGRADAERKRHDHGRGESAIATKTAPGVGTVAPEIIEATAGGGEHGVRYRTYVL